MCISVSGPSSCPSSSLVILFIHSAFSLCYFVFSILLYNQSVSFVSDCWYVFLSSPPNCRIFFHCFEMCSFVCIVLPFVDVPLIFLFSPVLSGLFPQVVLLFFYVLLFLFVPTYSSVFPLFYHFGLFSSIFFPSFPVEFTILILVSFFMFF